MGVYGGMYESVGVYGVYYMGTHVWRCMGCVCVNIDGWKGNMAGYCASVSPYLHELQASEIQHKTFSLINTSLTLGST